MTHPEQAADPDLRDVGHDPGRTRMLRTSLRVLAEGEAGPELQEMARDVLSGRVSLREALMSSAYSGALRRQAEQGMRQLNAMPAEEREALLESGREALARMAQEETGDSHPRP
jgi:hypothetical protein